MYSEMSRPTFLGGDDYTHQPLPAAFRLEVLFQYHPLTKKIEIQFQRGIELVCLEILSNILNITAEKDLTVGSGWGQPPWRRQPGCNNPRQRPRGHCRRRDQPLPP